MTFDTIANLAATAGTTTNEYCNVLGYYATGDKGGGDFYWDATSTQVENGGTIIGTFTTGRWKRLVNDVLNIKWFGAKGNNLSIDSLFIKKCIDTALDLGIDVYIPAGTYIIEEGILAFDNGFIERTFPNIYTASQGMVIFKAAALNNLPLISLRNGTATSGSGKYWLGGSFGSITFVDNSTDSTRTNVHAIELVGVKGMKFGEMVGNYLKGSLVFCAQKLFATTNPDPYAVFFCQFDILEANHCLGFSLENRNYLGFNGNIINNLRAINCTGGGYYGFGTANTINIASIGSCNGWAFDDGTNVDALGGAPLRFTVNSAEIDNVENGIRINRARQASFNKIRFNHRYKFDINPSSVYWPRTVVSLAAGASAGASEIYMNIAHRIEAATGASKSDMGIFIDGNNNVNISNVSIENRIFDNAGYGFNDIDLITNINVNTTVEVKRDGRLIYDSTLKNIALATATTSQSILNNGFGTLTSKVSFPNERYDRGSKYDTTTSLYTIPYNGLFNVNASLNLTLPISTSVRIAIMRQRGSSIVIVGYYASFAITAVSQIYEITRLIDFVKDDLVFISADQNSTTTSVPLTTSFNAPAENQFSIQVIR